MKFLHDVIYKGSLTADGSVTLKGGTQIGDSRLDVHNVYGAIVVGNGSTGTDITALTVRAMGTGGSKSFRVLNVNGDNEIFAVQENGFILAGGDFIPTNSRSGFKFDGFGISPLTFNIVARSNNTGGVFKGLVVTEGNLNGLSGGSFDTRYVEVSPAINITSGVELSVRGFYYNPTITNLSGSAVTHYAWENTVGDIKMGNLAGTGTRMVVADSTGKLGVQAITSFTESDTLDSVTDRGAITTNSITTGTHTINGYLSVTSATGGAIEFYPEGGSNATYSWMRAKLGSGYGPTLAWYGDVSGAYKAYGIYGPDITYDGLLIYREVPTLADVILMGAEKIALPSTQKLIWSSTTNVVHTPDLGLAREAAGLLQINNSSLNTYASLKLLNLTATGLAGSGTRMVTVDANGLLGSQAIPTGGTGSSTLSGLTDVTITSPSNNQLLKYDSATSKWINWTPNYLTSYTEVYQGTVTSVAIATGVFGTDINIDGSPITTSGTITINIPNASTTARGVITTGTQTIGGQKTFYSPVTVFDSNQSVTFLQGKASGTLYGTIYFGPFFQFELTESAVGGYLWKNGTGVNVMSLSPSGSFELSSLAGTGTRMVVANANGLLSTQAIPTGSGSETDPVFTASAAAGITSTNISNWNTAYGWGNHATAGYLTANQTITLSGAVTGSGTTSISTTLANSIVGIANLSATGTPSASTYLRGDNTWATLPASGGYTVTSQTANYTATATSGTLIVKGDTTGGTFTVTLPTAVGNQAIIIIKKTAGTANLVVDGAGSETIDGGLTATLVKINESIMLVSDNANWQIV